MCESYSQRPPTLRCGTRPAPDRTPTPPGRTRAARVPRLPLGEQRRHGEAFRHMAAFESALRSTAVMGPEPARLLADGVAGGTLAPGSPGFPPADR